MLGTLLEGVIERDPLTGDYHLVTEEGGVAKIHTMQELLAKYDGKEVRLTLASFEDLEQLAELAGQLSHTTSPSLPKVPFVSKKKG